MKFKVKLNNRVLRTKLFKDGFGSYEQARVAVKRLLRSKGISGDTGLAANGLQIVKS